MILLLKIAVRIMANALAILIASRILPGFVFEGTAINLITAGAILGLVNALVKPILTFISFPFIILTFGFFHIVVNIAVLFIAAAFIPQLEISGFWTPFWAIFIISSVNYLISIVEKK